MLATNYFTSVDPLAGPVYVKSPLDRKIEAKIKEAFSAPENHDLLSKAILSTLALENVDTKQDIARFVVSGWLEMDPEVEENADLRARLHERIKSIVNEELSIVQAMQDEYGRVDSFFRSSVEFRHLTLAEGVVEEATGLQLANDIQFLAHENQRVLIRVSANLFTPLNGKIREMRFIQLVVKGTKQDVEIKNEIWNDITPVVFPTSGDTRPKCVRVRKSYYDGVRPRTISLRPNVDFQLEKGEWIEADVAVIVQNVLNREFAPALCGNTEDEGILASE